MLLKLQEHKSCLSVRSLSVYLPYQSHASLLILSSACQSMLSLGNLCLVPALGLSSLEGLPDVSQTRAVGR